MFKTVIVWLVFAYVLWNIYCVFRDEKMGFRLFLKVWKGVKWWMLPAQVPFFILVVGTSMLLATFLPWTSWGWSTYLTGGGNILFTSANSAGGTASWLAWLPYAFIALLIFALPYLAKWEEDAFRKGRVGWKGIVKSSLVFGPAHLLAGIPIFAAIGLIWGGVYFSLVYRQACMKAFRSSDIRVKDGAAIIELDAVTKEDWPAYALRRYREIDAIFDESVMVSTAAHTLWNTTISLLFLLLLVSS